MIAGIAMDGKPKLLVKAFINGEQKTEPVPFPTPPDSSLETWIKLQQPVLVKSKNLASESRLVVECFDEIVLRIDKGNIKTAQNARTQLQITLIEKLALASPTAVTDWSLFLKELSHHLEQELGEKSDDLTEVRKVLYKAGSAIKSLESPKGASLLKPERISSQVRKREILYHPLRNLRNENTKLLNEISKLNLLRE